MSNLTREQKIQQQLEQNLLNNRKLPEPNLKTTEQSFTDLSKSISKVGETSVSIVAEMERLIKAMEAANIALRPKPVQVYGGGYITNVKAPTIAELNNAQPIVKPQWASQTDNTFRKRGT